MPTVRTFATQILEQNGIHNPQPGKWYLMQSWLQVFEDIEDQFGANTIYFIGLQVVHHSVYPSNIQDIYHAIRSLDIAYRTNVRGQNMGYYRIIDQGTNFIQLECYNPNPCLFDKGIITGVARKFKPASAASVSVELNNSAPQRVSGNVTNTYLINW
jgi:hypothetical protein